MNVKYNAPVPHAPRACGGRHPIIKKMTDIKRRIINGAMASLLAFAAAGVTSCSESQSYSELLREEEKAVNVFLAQKEVRLEVPSDSISFEMGEDAPFYRLDPDGYVYMQVISKGDDKNRVKSGDVVYFRFNRLDLKTLAETGSATAEGNSDNIGVGIYDVSSTYFVYDNDYMKSSTTWGTGIQMPLKFFGYGCEVNLVLRSYYGFSTDQSYCIPYLVNVRYFKPEY